MTGRHTAFVEYRIKGVGRSDKAPEINRAPQWPAWLIAVDPTDGALHWTRDPDSSSITYYGSILRCHLDALAVWRGGIDCVIEILEGGPETIMFPGGRAAA